MDKNRDHYSVLQVGRSASVEDIERAYGRLSKIYDPATSRKPRAAQRQREIQEAHDVLSDRKRRSDYDRVLSSKRAPGSSPVAGLGEGAVPKPYFLAGVIGAVVIVIVVVAVIALIASSGGGETVAVIDTPTSTPVGQTPAPTAPATPPEITGETVTTASGLQYVEITPGAGASPVIGDTVSVHYSGWLQSDNTLFDSSIPRGAPTSFVLGEVIPGWNEGLALMLEGGKRRLIIPPDLAYGAAGNGSIPANSTLIFDVELVDVIEQGATPSPTPAPATTVPTTATPAGMTAPATSSPEATP